MFRARPEKCGGWLTVVHTKIYSYSADINIVIRTGEFPVQEGTLTITYILKNVISLLFKIADEESHFLCFIGPELRIVEQ